MKFLSLYRISFYLMLFLATQTLCADPSDNKVAPLLPSVVAVAGALAFLTVDHHPRMGLARRAANVMALGSFGLVFLEYLIDPFQLLQALAHLLVYLQLIKMFLPKTAEDDWFLFLLGLMQVLVGAVITQADHVGLILFAWVLTAIWVLALFSLSRDAERHRLPTPIIPAGPPEPPREPYPGLLDLPFVVSAFRVMLLTLSLGGVIFLAMPRYGVAQRSPNGSEPVAKHLTGFDDEVQLGQLGEILENDSVVMSVELYDEHNAPYHPTIEPLWRGVTMTHYLKGRWHSQRRNLPTFPIVDHNEGEERKLIRQQIKLEANDSPVLFALRPMLEARSTRVEIELNPVDGTIQRSDVRSGNYDYEIVSDADSSQPQAGEAIPSPKGLQRLLDVPDSLKERLRSIAEPIVKDIPEEKLVERARALESYFTDGGRFSYTLRLNVVDRNVDPVEDFLVNRKEGHCEYFASALTLLLRSVGIPARMVNGFKGGDWNELAQVMSVRQKHAHSWVEAYVGPRHIPDTVETLAIWLTLDPTPPGERRQSLAQVGGFTSNFRQITDLVRYIWVFFVVGYNSDRQKRLIYEPIKELIREAKRGFAMMGQAIRPTIAKLLKFEDISDFISVSGFFVTFSALLLVAAVVRICIWIVTRFLRWYRGTDEDPSSLSPGVLFYRRLVQLLAEFGLERPPAETQSEFARRAAIFLTGRGSSAESVADVPRLVVDAFYRVRFGQLSLPPAALRSLEARLDALEASLRTTQQ